MNEMRFDYLETMLTAAGRDFRYPLTPDIAGAVRQRLQPSIVPRRGVAPAWRLALTLTIGLLLIVLLSALAIPTVRAQLLEFIQIGIIRILLAEPTAIPTPLPATPAAPGVFPRTAASPTPTRTIRPSPTPLASLLDLEGETTLEQALSQLDFPIFLPGYPPDLGLPDRVYLQDLNGQILVLVWLDPQRPGAVRLSLHEYAGENNLSGTKGQPTVIETASVNGQPAVWAVGPYLLKLSNGDYDQVRLIEGNVLIWEKDKVTYRLETDLPLEEAVRIAESLHPLNEPTPH